MKPTSTGETPICTSVPLKRPRYFPRQLITPAEMNLEQAYFRERLRLHNRMMHGWGTVCGALVCAAVDVDGNTRPWCVVVKPGYLLGPYGDEIYIDCEQKVDLRKACVVGTAGEPCTNGGTHQHRDPWCSEVFVRREAGPLYLAVRYREILARPVPVQPVGCGCDDATCEYSRWCDGYEICALPECPDSHKEEPPGTRELFSGPIPECPECADSPWVVLARVDVDADGTIERIDNCDCRRMAYSFGHGWWACNTSENAGPEPSGRRVRITDVQITDGEVLAGKTFGMRVLGGPFPHDAHLVVGKDLTVVEATVTDVEIRAKIEVTPAAKPGGRKVAVEDAEGRTLASQVRAVNIRRPSAGGG